MQCDEQLFFERVNKEKAPAAVYNFTPDCRVFSYEGIVDCTGNQTFYLLLFLEAFFFIIKNISSRFSVKFVLRETHLIRHS